MKTENLNGVELRILTPVEVKDWFDRNEIVLIDVRTPNEYAFEHIGGALLFPMSTFDPLKLPVQEGKPIVFHCGSGVRSHAIAERCAKAGITPINHMAGGFGAWKAANLPYRAINPKTGDLISKP